MINWIVDDGVPKRVHRMNLLNPDLKHAGISSGKHKAAQFCNVAVFAA